jgi:hypothetical protein
VSDVPTAPYGQAPGPPPPPPQQGPPWRIILSVGAIVVAIALVAIALTAGGSGSSGGNKKSGAKGEVFLQPISSTGDNPFTASVGTDLANVTPPPGAAGSGNAIATYSGGTPGLYGGTQNNASCDAAQMVTFLEQNPAKAAVWAATLGIQPSQIRSYVAELTSVVLRTDTRVTNHGYSNGRAVEIPAVLQAGTAVLVDRYGQPVVKCFCGNPLTPPRPLTTVVYTGPRWPTFQPTGITVVVKNTVIINTFTLVDPRTGQTFNRTPGINGTDGPPPGATTTTTQPPVTTTRPPAPPPTAAGPTDEQRALAKLDRDARACYPFRDIEQNVTEQRTTAPGPDPSSLVVRVAGTTASGGTQILTWLVDRQTLVFSPTNELAQRANNDCAALGSPG